MNLPHNSVKAFLFEALISTTLEPGVNEHLVFLCCFPGYKEPRVRLITVFNKLTEVDDDNNYITYNINIWMELSKPLRRCQRSVKVRVWIDAVGWNLQLLGAFNWMKESKPCVYIYSYVAANLDI